MGLVLKKNHNIVTFLQQFMGILKVREIDNGGLRLTAMNAAGSQSLVSFWLIGRTYKKEKRSLVN